MSRPPAFADARDPRGGYVIGKPRVTDALAKSLREAYHVEQALPPEWASLLRRLDRVPTP